MLLMARAGRALDGYAAWRARGLSGDALETALAFAEEIEFADASRATGAELLASIEEGVVDGVLAAKLRRWAAGASLEAIATARSRIGSPGRGALCTHRTRARAGRRRSRASGHFVRGRGRGWKAPGSHPRRPRPCKPPGRVGAPGRNASRPGRAPASPRAFQAPSRALDSEVRNRNSFYPDPSLFFSSRNERATGCKPVLRQKGFVVLSETKTSRGLKLRATDFYTDGQIMGHRPRPDDPNAPEPERPSFDEPPRYVFVRSARTFAHGIMRRAVLRRVLGNIDFRDEPCVLARYLDRVRRRWIDLATEYSDPVLPANDFVRDRLQALLDCRPPFAYVMPGGYKPCNIQSLCPACWARAVVEAWSPLDRGLFGEAPPRGVRLAGVTMLVRRQQYRFWRVPVRPDGETVNPDDFLPLSAFLDRRISRAGRSFYDWSSGTGSMARRPSEFVAWRRRGVACGLESTAIGTVLDCDGEIAAAREDTGMPTREWVVRFTTILFAPSAVAARVNTAAFDAAPGVSAGAVSVPAGASDARAVVNPSRRDVAAAVADACRYNARLILRGGDRRDRETVLEYLEARSGRRLRASFGDPGGLAQPARAGISKGETVPGRRDAVATTRPGSPHRDRPDDWRRIAPCGQAAGGVDLDPSLDGGSGRGDAASPRARPRPRGPPAIARSREHPGKGPSLDADDGLHRGARARVVRVVAPGRPPPGGYPWGWAAGLRRGAAPPGLRPRSSGKRRRGGRPGGVTTWPRCRGTPAPPRSRRRTTRLEPARGATDRTAFEISRPAPLPGAVESGTGARLPGPRKGAPTRVRRGWPRRGVERGGCRQPDSSSALGPGTWRPRGRASFGRRRRRNRASTRRHVRRPVGAGGRRSGTRGPARVGRPAEGDGQSSAPGSSAASGLDNGRPGAARGAGAVVGPAPHLASWTLIPLRLSL